MALPLRLVRPDVPGFAEFLDEVYARENLRLAGGSPASLADYRIQVRTLEHFFVQELAAQGEPPRKLLLSDVSDALLARCMSWLLSAGRQPRTCNKLRRTIRAIHNFALVEKELPGKPLRVKKFKESKRQPSAWRTEQVSQLLAAALAMPGLVGDTPAGQWHYAHLMFLLNTGSRITAAMDTPSALLDLDNGWVTIPAEVQKHNADEVIDLLPATVEALRAIAPQRHQRIFDAWPYDRSQRKWAALRKRLKQMLVAAGLFRSLAEVPPRLDFFHKLRKSFATFIHIGAGHGAAQELMGHSHPSVTDAYIDRRQTKSRPSCRTLLADKLIVPKRDRQPRLFDS